MKKTISIDRYRRDLAHTVKDAMLQYPDKCEGKSEATKYEYAQKLDAKRSHVTHWAREQIKGILLKTAVIKNVRVGDDRTGANRPEWLHATMIFRCHGFRIRAKQTMRSCFMSTFNSSIIGKVVMT